MPSFAELASLMIDLGSLLLGARMVVLEYLDVSAWIDHSGDFDCNSDHVMDDVFCRRVRKEVRRKASLALGVTRR